jgi:hypothetical protein
VKSPVTRSKNALGLLIILAGLAGLGVCIVRLASIGTCVAGSYLSEAACPSGTGSYMAAIGFAVVSIVLGIGLLVARGGSPQASPLPGRLPHAPVAAPVRPASPPPTVPPAADTLTRLEHLAELKRHGVLSSEEFETQKARLLRGS